MGIYNQNVPVNCDRCGFGPIYGRESTEDLPHLKQRIFECRWVCSNCGTLVRVDEKTEDIPEDKNG